MQIDISLSHIQVFPAVTGSKTFTLTSKRFLFDEMTRHTHVRMKVPCEAERSRNLHGTDVEENHNSNLDKEHQ